MGKKLYVGNLNFRTTDDSLAQAFAAKGFPVVSAKVITDRETGRSRGFAFVEMDSDATAADALGAMHDCDVEGRAIKVTEARAKTDGPGGGRGAFGGGPPRGAGDRGGFGGRDSRPFGGPRGEAGGAVPRDGFGGGREGGYRGEAPRGGGRDGGGFRSYDARPPRSPGFGGMPAGGAPFPPAEEPQGGRRGRGERRDLRKQHERRDDHDDDDF